MSRGCRFVVLLLAGLVVLLATTLVVVLRSNNTSSSAQLLLRAIPKKINEDSTNIFADADDTLHNAAPPISHRMSRNLLFLFWFNGGNSDTSSNLVEHSVEHNGLTRWFLEYQQQPQPPTNSAALVILLHGGGQSMYRLFDRGNLGSRRWLDLSDQHGFLLLAPNGVSKGWFGWFQQTKGQGYWNDLRESAGEEESNEDDVGFLIKVIDWAVTERQIDPTRVYFTGASNGGMMTYRMIMERSDLVAAGAALIANLPDPDVPPFNPPAIPTPMFIMNGSNDPLVPFEGGCVSRCGTRGSVRSSAATRDYFVQVNQAGPVITEGIINDIPNDNCRIRTEMYASDTAPVQYNVMEGAGHVYATKESLGFLTEWFVSLFLGPPCREAESADLAWEFMSKFAK